MNDSIVSPASWLILMHQVPPSPDYLRVKVRRRLQRLGSIALKNTVYVLPLSGSTTEDFVWLRNEILADGGDATLCAARLIAGITDAELEQRFRAERSEDYRSIVDAVHQAIVSVPPSDFAGEVARLRRRFDQIRAIDYFASNGRGEAERALDHLRATVSTPSQAGASEASPSALGASSGPRGRTWVTRSGVFVDRIASAWLIRRFIDADARFAFAPPEHSADYRPAPGEFRFDMYGGEYTHEGDRCTFEVLLSRFGLEDPALNAIAEIVHDIDCKDEKFDRPETAGIASILGGLARAEPDDNERLRLGAPIFDALYQQFGSARGS